MSARDEVRDLAELLKWEVANQHQFDVITRGDRAVQVRYRKDDSVDDGKQYQFVSVDDLKLIDVVPPKNKKETVLSWLAA